MQSEIQREVERIVGGKAVSVTDIDAQAGDGDEANHRIKLETANATYTLPAQQLFHLLRELPDEIGVNALRQSIEQQILRSSPLNRHQS